ncbi:tetratricopeptide repeat protein [Thermodesulfobacteriota bacterium]
MQRKIVFLSIILLLSAFPARAENAMDYFDLELKSTMTRTKINYFSRALELDPFLVEAYEKRGVLYFFQRKYDHVIQDFQAYIELAPPKAEAYRMLGMGYLKIDNTPSAIDNFTRAIEIDKGKSGAYSGRAKAHYLSDNYEKAILDSTRAIELGGDPRRIADTYRTRAKAYRKIGKTRLAAVDARSSWKVDPRYAYYMQSFYTYANPEDMRKAGLIAIIGIAFVAVFNLRLKPPEKDDEE